MLRFAQCREAGSVDGSATIGTRGSHYACRAFFDQGVEKRREEAEMRGLIGNCGPRATGTYTDVREDCERLSNQAVRPRSSFATPW